MKKAEITVFLALLLSCICGLLCMIIESARTQAMRLRIEELMDAGLHSCFGEYQQELFGYYDLLYIDTSYGKAEGTIDTALVHLREYIEENFGNKAGTAQTGDWFKLSVEKIAERQYLLASDKRGHALRNQAVHFMKAYSGSSHLSVTAQAADDIAQIAAVDFAGEWESALRKAEGFGKPFTNVSRIVKDAGNKDVLDLLAVNAAGRNLNSLSALPYQEVPSKRSLKAGSAVKAIPEAADAEPLFDEYLLLKCADYTDGYNDRVLCCELEYILYGKPSDRENLELIVNQLMELREGENLNRLFSDEGKFLEAEKLARKLVGIYGIEGFAEAVRDSILYAWAYAESAIEVSCLLSGGRAEVFPSRGSWVLPLNQLLEFREYIGNKGGSGLLYEEYLGAFLHHTEADIKILRCMDIIEMNLRVLKNPAFRIDGCLEYLEAEVYFKSSYGYSYQIKRDFGYETSYRSDS